MSQRVFVDTNCFLHLRDLKDLPWSELFPGEDVEIFVAPVVVDELDRLKIDRSGRTRDRSRAALDQIAAASAEPGMRFRLRAGRQSIWLVVAEARAIDWAAFRSLDSTRADDQLVAAAATEPSDTSTALLSFDTGPLIRARTIGLPAHRSPETWALPPLRDEAEQRIARLERELAAAKATRPDLTVRFLDTDESGDIRLLIPDLPPLPPAVHRRLMTELQARWPRESVSATPRSPYSFQIRLDDITESQAAQYHADYATFLEEAEQQLIELHRLIALALTFGEVRHEIRNESQMTASNLRASLSCSDGLRMFGHRSDMEDYGGALQRMHRPERPRPFHDLPTVYDTFHRLREPPRDPTGFYWLERPKGAREAVHICDEFRPQQRSPISTYIVAPEVVVEGAVELQISATNLAQPIRVAGAIRFQQGPATWTTPAVLRRLPQWMAHVIEQELAAA